jgi:hypothetical protein
MGITGIYELLCSGIIKCGFCEYEYHIKSKIENDVERIFYKHNNKDCRLYSKILEVENINKIFNVFHSTYYKIFDDIKIIIQNNQEMWEMNLNEYSKKINEYHFIIQGLTKKINCSNDKLSKMSFENKQNSCYEKLFKYIKEVDYIKKRIQKNNSLMNNKCISELIEKCLVFRKYLVIESSGVLFIFHYKSHNENFIIKNLDKVNSNMI